MDVDVVVVVVVVVVVGVDVDVGFSEVIAPDDDAAGDSSPDPSALIDTSGSNVELSSGRIPSSSSTDIVAPLVGWNGLNGSSPPHPTRHTKAAIDQRTANESTSRISGLCSARPDSP